MNIRTWAAILPATLMLMTMESCKSKQELAPKVRLETTCGDIVLNSSASTVSRGEQTLELSKNENRILTVLMENRGRVVSRDTLMNKLWETDCFIDENTLTVNVTRLRKSLAEIGINDLIKTRKGMGYIIE